MSIEIEKDLGLGEKIVLNGRAITLVSASPEYLCRLRKEIENGDDEKKDEALILINKFINSKKL
jgi:hypothetical protein